MAQDAPSIRRPALAAGLFLVAAIGVFYLLVSRPVLAPGNQEFIISAPTMGTVFNIKIIAPPGTHDADIGRRTVGIQSLLEDINAKMSTYDPDSELSRFNASQSTEPFDISEETFSVIAAAQIISEDTDGAFDITVGPLVNAWGFGPDKSKIAEPSDEELTQIQASVGYEKLKLDADTPSITKTTPNLEADLSAIAKGYAVDRVAEYLESESFPNYMVEIGGEVRTGGVNLYGQPWRIGVKRPVHNGAPTEIVPMQNRAMATSGDYENYYEVDGVRISHTIDPSTSKPITHTLASVTVLHEQCMYADAYATAINVMGPDRGLAFAEEKGLAVMLIIRTAEDTFEITKTTTWPEE